MLESKAAPESGETEQSNLKNVWIKQTICSQNVVDGSMLLYTPSSMQERRESNKR